MTSIENLYGKPGSLAAARRGFIHEHIIQARSIAYALPTNVRSIYYVGKGTAWSDDKERTTVRKPSQDVSDACQWLIDQNLVGDDEIVDANGHEESAYGTADLLKDVRHYAAHLAMDPWSPNPIPVLMCEGRNDLALVQPIGQERRIKWVALGGMAGRGHLRRVATTLDPATPIGYVGDWNRSGFDIERNAETVLRDRGWRGTWTRLLLTDADAAALTQKTTVDRRDGQVGQSVESAELPVPTARRLLLTWLDTLLPAVPDADETRRNDIIAALAAL